MSSQYSIDVMPEIDGKGYYTMVPVLPGCFSQGDTIEAAIRNTRKAIGLHIKMLKRRKQPIPDDGIAFHAVVEVLA